MSLVLPQLPSAVPGRFIIGAKGGDLQQVALALTDARILREEHWRKDDLRQSVINAFSALADQHLPDPLARFAVLVVEDTVKGEFEYESSNDYADAKKLTRGTKISAVAVTFDHDQLVHRVIGPTILWLERRRYGLGQTVLYWLHKVFSESARALDPINGIWMAGCNYWMGEEDESMRLEEEIGYLQGIHEEDQKKLPKSKRQPWDEEAAKNSIEVFRRADYEQAIPPRFGSKFGRTPELTLEQLKGYSRGKIGEIVSAILPAAALVQKIRYTDKNNDIGYFDQCRWDASPYLLRWQCDRNKNRQDPLAQIYDDFMNEMMNSGDGLMDVNAIFAFHDQKSLLDAVKRFERYLQILRTAENILRAVQPNNL